MSQKSVRILVAEDSPVVRHHIVTLLKLEGWEVAEAVDGEEALRKAFAEPPDLIISDLLLPRLTGLEVLDRIRKSESLSTVPFILLSAHTEWEDIRRGMEYGADDYLPKPFTSGELLGAVRRLLRRAELVCRSIEEKLQQLREVMFYALPHEFRTAISGVQGYTDLLIQKLDNGEPISYGELREIGETIRTAASRLNRLVENFIIYAQLRAVANDEEVLYQMRQKVTSPAREVVGDVALSLAVQYEREEDLDLVLNHDVPVAIEYHHWHKILYEVVDNAFKFSSPGNRLRIRDTVEGNDYVVIVQDQGRGMTPEQREHIAPYVQFGRKQYEQQGMGLGLAIALLLMEFHHGMLAFSDTPNGGTTVRIVIPTSPVLRNEQSEA